MVERQQESPDFRFQRESENASPGGIDKDGGGTVDDIPGGYLLPAGLQGCVRSGHPVGASQDGKDGAHTHVDVDVRGTIEGIEDDDVFAGRGVVDGDRVLVLLETRKATLSRAPRQCETARLA